MALINYTSPNVNNTAASDAIKHFGQIGASGIFKIEGATLSSTNNNGLITFSKGYVSIQGRFLEMEQGTTFNVALTGGARGFVCIKYDWQLQEAVLINIEATDVYPVLTQSNMIASNDGEYYLPICKYSKTSTSLTLIDLEDEYYIEAYVDKLKSLEAKVDAMGFEEVTWANLNNVVTFNDNHEFFKFGNYVMVSFSVIMPTIASATYDLGTLDETFIPEITETLTVNSFSNSSGFYVDTLNFYGKNENVGYRGKVILKRELSATGAYTLPQFYQKTWWELEK